jgi:hypothetical protein
MRAIFEGRWPFARVQTPAALWGLLGLFYLGLLAIVGPFAWDDGAIALAFARTLADTGRFALTPVSEVVEGAASLLWVGGLSALHGLHAWSFDAWVRVSQGLALLAWLGTLWALERKLRRPVPQRAPRWWAVGVLALLPMPMAEVFNGMEMTAFALILLGVVEAFERRHVALWVLIPLALLVRFEAVFYLGLAFSALALCRPQDRSWAWRAGAYMLTVWMLVALWRLQVFGDWMPNIVRAKMQAPYTPGVHGLALVQAKAEGLLAFLKVNAAWLLALVWLGWRAVRAGRGAGVHRWDIKVWLVLAFALLGGVTGANWGYEGRLGLAALPLLVLMVAEHWRGPAGREAMAGQAAGAAAWPLVGLLLATAVINAKVAVGDAQALWRGAYFQGYLPPALQANADARMRAGQVKFAHWMGDTPASSRATGLVVERVRQSLGLHEIALLAPDVGGLALCCPQIRVLDYSLLSNRDLARSGYAGLDAYLQAQRPDLVITHGLWSAQSGIYALPAFDREYVPVVIGGMQMWLRNEHLTRLLRSPMWLSQGLDGPQDLKLAKFGGKPADLAYVQSRVRQTIWSFRAP